MGIEWFRELSMTILGFVASAMLIIVTVLIYRLYRKACSALLLVKLTSQIAYDNATMIQQGPLITILALIEGIRAGCKGISKMCKKDR